VAAGWRDSDRKRAVLAGCARVLHVTAWSAIYAAWARHCRPDKVNHWPRRMESGNGTPLIVRTPYFEQRLTPLEGRPGWFTVDYFVRNGR
jgi:hypothetical protein